MILTYQIVNKKDFTDDQRKEFAEMLDQQGKVSKDNLGKKLDRCLIACFANLNGKPAGIGAIKQKTKSDFSEDKANLPALEKEFDWELGYIYTVPKQNGKGIASTIVKLLIAEYGSGNLMASTEINANPGMVRILEKNGFEMFGNPWKSSRHDNFLGLYLKFENHK